MRPEIAISCGISVPIIYYTRGLTLLRDADNEKNCRRGKKRGTTKRDNRPRVICNARSLSCVAAHSSAISNVNSRRTCQEKLHRYEFMTFSASKLTGLPCDIASHKFASSRKKRPGLVIVLFIRKSYWNSVTKRIAISLHLIHFITVDRIKYLQCAKYAKNIFWTVYFQNIF